MHRESHRRDRGRSETHPGRDREDGRNAERRRNPMGVAANQKCRLWPSVAPWRPVIEVRLIGSRVRRLRDRRWPQRCRAGSLRSEGEQQANLDAFIGLFRHIARPVHWWTRSRQLMSYKWRSDSIIMRTVGTTYKFGGSLRGIQIGAH
jgi:hypothetical protein